MADELDEITNEPVEVIVGGVPIKIKNIGPKESSRFRKWAIKKHLENLREMRQEIPPDVYVGIIRSVTSGEGIEESVKGALSTPEGVAQFIFVSCERLNGKPNLAEITKACQVATEDELTNVLKVMNPEYDEEEVPNG